MQTELEERRAGASSAAAGLLARMSDIGLIALSALWTTMVLTRSSGHPTAEASLVASATTFAMMLFPVFGVYQAKSNRSKYGVAANTCIAWIISQACATLVIYSLYHTLFVPPDWQLGWALTSTLALVASRLVTGTMLDRLGRTTRRDCPVAIAGTGAHVGAILDRIAQSPPPGFRAAAILDMFGAKNDNGSDVPHFDELSTFASYIRTHAIPEVWIALPITEARDVVRMLDTFRHDLVNVRFMPDVSQLAMFDGEMVDLAGAPAINLVASPLSSYARVQKAVFDRVFAAAALVGIAPLMFAIALAIRLSSPGPALFRQHRKGADGKVFTIYKFRTMRLHAAADGVVQQATRGDPRVTRIGAFLRRTSLDELPQFINVLRGDMSVVGPRPHAIEHDNLYQKIVDGYIHRYRVKPGITGWAQINGLRGETDRIDKMQRRIEADLYYLRNWSFALDMRIVLATITSGWTHSNAY